MAARFGVPVFLYEEASTNPARKNLEDIRRGEFEGLAAKMATPGWAPDFGPPAPHPSAGASVIGARMPLIAYNINLNTDRLDVAKKIAAAIRHSSGGLRYVKAAGFMLEDRGIVQVSMNLTNYEKTPIFRVFEIGEARGGALRRVDPRERNRRAGAVGRADGAAEFYLQIEGFGRRSRCWRTSCRRASERAESRLRGVERRESPAVESAQSSASVSWRPSSDRLLLPPRRHDPERAHLAIEIAALDAEHFRGARDIAVLRGERAQDVIAFEPFARLVQRERRRPAAASAATAAPCRGTPGRRARSCLPAP